MLISTVAKRIFGTSNDRELKQLRAILQTVNSFEQTTQKLDNAQLQAKTASFKERLSRGEPLDSVLPEAFAVVREASTRVLGQRHYDVQLIGGMSLHRGRIAEMRTGEGKTLTATAPMYLNALTGKGTHLITVNDYLARRDATHMGQIYGFLGLSTGIIVHGINDRERQAAYRADITYGTNNEFGFDYLRDNMKFRLEDYVQRELNFAIVDEVDSILIDEARTPLIISGPTDDTSELYVQIDRHVRAQGGLTRDLDYTFDEKTKSASLTEAGIDKMESRMKVSNLFDPVNIELLHHVNQALRAHVIYKRDVDYVVRDGEIIIVDEFTGRLMPGRRWSDGLHQAIEAKEGVTIENENQTLATITFQNFFRMYSKLSGMTGTADTEATEFKQIYSLDVTVIPTNKDMIRTDHPDAIYKNSSGKFRAVVEEIRRLKAKGQPVLVGTVSVEKSELLHKLLKDEGIPHAVLNAKQHEREAYVIAQAGRKGSVTISTNMAGRGTDILLGGQPELLAQDEIGRLKSDATDSEKKEYQDKLNEAITRWKVTCAREREEVLKLGGLFILGTERHESRRIDNQLRGRSGRQGDPGESKFYLSFDDDLLRIFSRGDFIQKMVAGMEEDMAVEHSMTTHAIENAQKKVEAHNYDIRKHLLEYDDVMNQQRKVIYSWRKEVLREADLKEMMFSMVSEVGTQIGNSYFPNGRPLKNELGQDAISSDGLKKSFLQTLTELESVDVKEVEPYNENGVRDLYKKKALEIYDRKVSQLGSENIHNLEKMVFLTTIDQLWKDHLLAMDHLREGIGLQGYGQKDPLIAYKKEGYRFFEMMVNQIQSDAISKLFSVRLEVEDPEAAEAAIRRSELEQEAQVQAALQSLSYNLDPDTAASNSKGMSAGREQPLKKTASASSLGIGPNGQKIGRNDLCFCGSGKKYKKCHGVS